MLNSISTGICNSKNRRTLHLKNWERGRTTYGLPDVTSVGRLVPTISTEHQKISVMCCTRRLIYRSSYLQMLMQMLFTAYSLIIRLKLLPQAHHKPWGLVVSKVIVRLASFTVESIISHDVYLLTTALVLLDPNPHCHIFEFE
jgi:hypothetical protein